MRQFLILSALFAFSTNALADVIPPRPAPRPAPTLSPRPDLRPVSIEVTRAMDTLHFSTVRGTRGPIYIGVDFALDLTITAQGADSVRIYVDEESYQGLDALTIDRPRDRVSRFRDHVYPLNGQSQVEIKLGAMVKPEAGFLSGDIPLFLKVIVTKDGAEKVHRIKAGNLPIIAMKKFKVSKTYDVMKKVGFNLYKTPTGPTPWVCEGTSSGPSGSFKVGMREKDGDLAFNIRSGPLGGNCWWTGRQELRADHPWQIIAMNFVSDASSKCRVGGSDNDFRRDPPPPGQPLRHNEIFVGKFPRIELQQLSQPLDRFPILHVSLDCEWTASNDHSVDLRFSEIEMLGPDDETVEQAFNGLMRR